MDQSVTPDLLVVRVLLKNGVALLRLVEPTVKDPISQLVVEALLVDGASNLSRIADYVKGAKGSSSRTTVRSRLADLRQRGIVSRKLATSGSS